MPVVKLDHVVIHPDSGSIVAVAEFAVPADRLFRALTAAEEIGRWWGGAGALPSVLWVGVPLRGTGWRAEGSRMAGRAVFTVFGDFLDVDAPHRVEATWHGSWDRLAMTRLSLRFEPTLQGSVLTLMHQGFLGREDACRRQGRIWYLAFHWLTVHFKAEAEREARTPLSLTERQDAC
jgi:uncharacterized protein YndB with AHSA1/START domain